MELYIKIKSNQLNLIINLYLKVKDKVTILYRGLYSPNKKSLLRDVKEYLVIYCPTLKNIYPR